jgi:hypothetical protein
VPCVRDECRAAARPSPRGIASAVPCQDGRSQERVRPLLVPHCDSDDRRARSVQGARVRPTSCLCTECTTGRAEWRFCCSSGAGACDLGPDTLASRGKQFLHLEGLADGCPRTDDRGVSVPCPRGGQHGCKRRSERPDTRTRVRSRRRFPRASTRAAPNGAGPSEDGAAARLRGRAVLWRFCCFRG